MLAESTLLVTVLLDVRKVLLLTTSLLAGLTNANFSGKCCGGEKRENRQREQEWVRGWVGRWSKLLVICTGGCTSGNRGYQINTAVAGRAAPA